ncbi:MAG: GDP-L-fucose synthase family protein [Syntrophothermus sp.]
MEINSKILVLGSTGMVGSSIVRKLKRIGFENILTPTHDKLELCSQDDVHKYFVKHEPEYIFMAAGYVGGILANSAYPVEFLYRNTQMALNVIKNADFIDAKKCVYLGSSCIYPKNCLQPIKEEYLLSGYLEPTNEAYALAKITGLRFCQAYNKLYNEDRFIMAMPCSLYGIGDNFDALNCHMIPALMRRMHDAKVNGIDNIEIWGTGTPRREFMYVDDLSDALLYLISINSNNNKIINVGTGIDYTILDIASSIKRIVGYNGKFSFDISKPDGTYRKVLDTTKITELGWSPKTTFDEGLTKMYNWCITQEIFK